MKNFTLLMFAFTLLLFSSCRKCYDCSKQGAAVVSVCNDRKTVKSDLAIYEGNGYTCAKK